MEGKAHVHEAKEGQEIRKGIWIEKPDGSEVQAQGAVKAIRFYGEKGNEAKNPKAIFAQKEIRISHTQPIRIEETDNETIIRFIFDPGEET